MEQSIYWVCVKMEVYDGAIAILEPAELKSIVAGTKDASVNAAEQSSTVYLYTSISHKSVADDVPTHV